MKTLDKFDVYSEEYTKETQRENAYYVSMFLCIIAEGHNIPKELREAIFKVAEMAEKIVGKEEFTVGLDFES